MSIINATWNFPIALSDNHINDKSASKHGFIFIVYHDARKIQHKKQTNSHSIANRFHFTVLSSVNIPVRADAFVDVEMEPEMGVSIFQNIFLLAL